MMQVAPWRRQGVDVLFDMLAEADGQWVDRDALIAASCISEKSFHVTLWRLRHKHHLRIECDRKGNARPGAPSARYRLVLRGGGAV